MRYNLPCFSLSQHEEGGNTLLLLSVIAAVGDAMDPG